MIRKLTQNDREKAIAFLEELASYSVFFIADIETLGFDSDFFSVWGDEGADGGFKCLFGLFYNTFMLYWTDNAYDASAVAGYIKDNNIEYKVFVARDKVFREFSKYQAFPEVHTTYLCELRSENFMPVRNDVNTAIARMEDVEDIVALRSAIEEFRTFEMGAEIIRSGVERGTTIVVKEDGRVVSSAMCGAVTMRFANIGGVCTYREYRGRGYASKAVSDLSEMLLDQGITCSLTYDNPEAGSIYKRLGYREVGCVNLGVK